MPWLFSSQRLALTLFPTEQCNFRCTYCYEDFAKGRMAPGVIEGVCRLLDHRSGDLKWLSIGWFGGEPLLAADIIEHIGHHAKSLSEAHGFFYKSGATTNGWLLDVTMADRLMKAGVTGYQITLDGPAEVHDTTRVRVSGRGTFDRIWGNLQDLARSTIPFNILIRCHVTAANVQAWKAFAPRVQEMCNDPRFKVHVHKVGRWGGPKDSEIPVATQSQFAEVKNLFARIEFDEPDICYAATPSSLLVRADGTLVRCTIALNDPRNEVGKINPDGTIQLNRDRLQPWFKGWEGEYDLLGCPLKGLPKLLPILDQKVDSSKRMA